MLSSKSIIDIRRKEEKLSGRSMKKIVIRRRKERFEKVLRNNRILFDDFGAEVVNN